MRLTLLQIPTPNPVFDTGPRSIAAVRVLRISVTDRCNFRCLYCMPEEGVRWLGREQILTYEEIAEIVRAALEIHGIRRFKLTGGEPTVRHNIVELVRILRRIDGIEDLSMTTNGQLLEDLAGPLRDAGQDRGMDAFIAEPEVRALIERELGPLVAVDRSSEAGVGPAIPYRLAHVSPAGRIAFISAMSAPFCSTCNRLRLTATGTLRSCLFEGGEVETRDLLRGIADPAARHAALAGAMADCVRLKPEVHSQ